ncbi:unnamed protein product [Mytilus coruscus]|uniref:Uncharacterized protein n=1 Tax=Mytilus coruscus TaxID=42192 RepID=A0A6J8E4I7_MYTCO|nr:unnamed protein product [Mytilus coruscus]
MNYDYAALEVTAKREAVLMPQDIQEPHFNRNGLTAATDCVSDLLLQKLGISISGRPISVKASPSRKNTIQRMTPARHFSSQTSTTTFPPPMTSSPTSPQSSSTPSSTFNSTSISVQYSSPPASPTGQNSSTPIGNVTLILPPSPIYVPPRPSSPTITSETSLQAFMQSAPSSP